MLVIERIWWLFILTYNAFVLGLRRWSRFLQVLRRCLPFQDHVTPWTPETVRQAAFENLFQEQEDMLSGPISDLKDEEMQRRDEFLAMLTEIQVSFEGKEEHRRREFMDAVARTDEIYARRDALRTLTFQHGRDQRDEIFKAALQQWESSCSTYPDGKFKHEKESRTKILQDVDNLLKEQLDIAIHHLGEEFRAGESERERMVRGLVANPAAYERAKGKRRVADTRQNHAPFDSQVQPNDPAGPVSQQPLVNFADQLQESFMVERMPMPNNRGRFDDLPPEDWQPNEVQPSGDQDSSPDFSSPETPDPYSEESSELEGVPLTDTDIEAKRQQKFVAAIEDQHTRCVKMLDEIKGRQDDCREIFEGGEAQRRETFDENRWAEGLHAQRQQSHRHRAQQTRVKQYQASYRHYDAMFCNILSYYEGRFNALDKQHWAELEDDLSANASRIHNTYKSRFELVKEQRDKRFTHTSGLLERQDVTATMPHGPECSSTPSTPVHAEHATLGPSYARIATTNTNDTAEHVPSPIPLSSLPQPDSPERVLGPRKWNAYRVRRWLCPPDWSCSWKLNRRKTVKSTPAEFTSLAGNDAADMTPASPIHHTAQDDEGLGALHEVRSARPSPSHNPLAPNQADYMNDPIVSVQQPQVTAEITPAGYIHSPEHQPLLLQFSALSSTHLGRSALFTVPSAAVQTLHTNDSLSEVFVEAVTNPYPVSPSHTTVDNIETEPTTDEVVLFGSPAVGPSSSEQSNGAPQGAGEVTRMPRDRTRTVSLTNGRQVLSAAGENPQRRASARTGSNPSESRALERIDDANSAHSRVVPRGPAQPIDNLSQSPAPVEAASEGSAALSATPRHVVGKLSNAPETSRQGPQSERENRVLREVSQPQLYSAPVSDLRAFQMGLFASLIPQDLNEIQETSAGDEYYSAGSPRSQLSNAEDLSSSNSPQIGDIRRVSDRGTAAQSQETVATGSDQQTPTSDFLVGLRPSNFLPLSATLIICHIFCLFGAWWCLQLQHLVRCWKELRNERTFWKLQRQRAQVLEESALELQRRLSEAQRKFQRDFMELQIQQKADARAAEFDRDNVFQSYQEEYEGQFEAEENSRKQVFYRNERGWEKNFKEAQAMRDHNFTRFQHFLERRYMETAEARAQHFQASIATFITTAQDMIRQETTAFYEEERLRYTAMGENFHRLEDLSPRTISAGGS